MQEMPISEGMKAIEIEFIYSPNEDLKRLSLSVLAQNPAENAWLPM